MPGWSKSAEPALEAGPAGAFDALAAMGPSVLKVGAQYMMWYDARQPGPGRSIPSVGLATSTDGRTWTKHPGNPVIAPEARWPWVLPLTQVEGGGFRIWFGADVGLTIKTARSADGIAWTNVQTALSAGSAGSFDDLNCASPRVVRAANRYLMLYDAGSSASPQAPTDKFQGLGLARSPDGLNWTKVGLVLPLGAEGSPDAHRVFGACALYDDIRAIFHVWYTATASMRDIRSIRHASSSDGANWARDDVLPLAASLDPQAYDFEVMHPCVIRDGNWYRMWFTGMGYPNPATGQRPPACIGYAEAPYP